MTVAEIKNQIALKEKELNKLKELLKKEERKAKTSYSLIKHQCLDNGEEKITIGIEHICQRKSLGEPIRVARYMVKKAKQHNIKIWYELLNNDTNKVELVIE